MYKYAEIVDESIGLCNVGLGSDSKFYLESGMKFLDVTKGFDNNWYLTESLETECYKKRMTEYQKKCFERDFFETSLGWIRRTVDLKNGQKKDFLSDLLLQIKAGLELGQEVQILTYKTPDFTCLLNEEYLKTLQENKLATIDFVKECLFQTVKDWNGNAI